jgi:hypothetical protein
MSSEHDNTYGLDPHSAADEARVSAAVGGFDPAFVTIVRIHSDGAWHLGANHAAIARQGDPDEQALAILAKTVRPGNGRRRFREFGPGSNASDAENFHKRGRYAPLGATDLDDFEAFGFASQHAIYIWFDSPRVSLKADELISFSRQLADGSPADPNDSFFARAIDPKGRVSGPVIAIRNYFARQSADGSIVPRDAATDRAMHKLNLHFILPGKLPLPIVLDPSTGNGAGNEP